MRRKPKGDKRARTRTKLLEAARDLTRERGYENTTLADIANRAGMTTGAIYGNFRNRDELFIALAETYWAPIKPEVEPGADLPAVMKAISAATIAALPDRNAAAMGYLTGRAYALSHPEVLQQAHDRTSEGYDLGAAWLRSVVAEHDLPFPADTMVRIIHALTEGLVLHRILTPELIGDDVFNAAFALLAGCCDKVADATSSTDELMATQTSG